MHKTLRAIFQAASKEWNRLGEYGVGSSWGWIEMHAKTQRESKQARARKGHEFLLPFVVDIIISIPIHVEWSGLFESSPLLLHRVSELLYGVCT